MNSVTRRYFVWTVASLIFASLVWVRGSRLPTAFREASGAAEAQELQGLLGNEAQRGTKLDEQRNAVQARIDAKNAVVAELAAGRMTLAEAASQFRQIISSCPEFFDRIHAAFPDLTEEEAVNRNVIAFATAVLEKQPERTDTLARLESEYADRHRPNGGRMPRCGLHATIER